MKATKDALMGAEADLERVTQDLRLPLLADISRQLGEIKLHVVNHPRQSKTAAAAIEGEEQQQQQQQQQQWHARRNGRTLPEQNQSEATPRPRWARANQQPQTPAARSRPALICTRTRLCPTLRRDLHRWTFGVADSVCSGDIH